MRASALLGLALLSCAPAATRPVRVLPSAALDLVPAASHYREGLAPPLREPRVSFEARLSPSSRVLLRYEPALEGVARAIGETFARTGQPPATSLIHWLLWRAGIAGQLAGTRLVVSRGAAGGARFDRELAQWAQRTSSEVHEPHAFALARFDTAMGDDVQVLVLAEDLVELELPRALSESAKLTLTGRLKVPSSGLTLFVDDDGGARRFSVPLDERGRFSVAVVGPDRAGRRFVELVATNAEHGWSRSVALAPLSVDAPEPAVFDAPVAAPSAQSWRTRLRAEWAARRSAAGLAPLEASTVLDARAEALATAFATAPGKPPALEGEPFVSAQRVDDFDDFLWLEAHRPAIRAALLSPCPLQHGAGLAPGQDGQLIFVELLECPPLR